MLLAFAAVVLASAWVLSLRRRTQGRLKAMARLAAGDVWSVTPPRWFVKAVAAELLAFAGTFVAGVAVTAFVIWLGLPHRPPPTEAYEGFGEAMLALDCFGYGATKSLCAAIPVGFLVGGHVASWPDRRRSAANSG